MDVDHVGSRIEMIIPDLLEKHRARDDAPCISGKIFDQAEFARLQIDDSRSAPGAPLEEVNFEIADMNDGFTARRFTLFGSAEQRTDTGVKLGKRKGLDEIIVGACLKPLDTIIDRPYSRQH